MNLSQNYNIFKNLILYTFVLLLIFFVYKIQFIAILFFGAFIIASAIDPLVKILSKKMPRKAAIAILTITGVFLIAVFLIPLINIAIAQSLSFLKDFPTYSKKILSLIFQADSKGIIGLLDSLGFHKWTSYVKNIGILPNMTQITAFISSVGQNVLTSSLDITKSFLTSIMFMFTLAMLTLFMLIDKHYLSDKLFSFFPEEKREKTISIMRIISKKVGGYVISQIIIIAAVFILVSLGLYFLKVQYALILGILAAFLELIPVIGPIITALLIGFVALAQYPLLAVFALIMYGVSQWLVDNIIRPFVVAKFLEMHPLTFIFSLFTGAAFFGIAGLILAPAIAAVICVLIDELYLKKINICKYSKPEV